MTPLCAACIAGPSRVEGHPDLLARSLGEHGMAFACRHCQALWSRSYSTTGDFAWVRSPANGQDVGMRLPLLPVANAAPPAGRMNSAPGAADHWLATQLSWKRPKRAR
jgi:hypothetical protein